MFFIQSLLSLGSTLSFIFVFFLYIWRYRLITTIFLFNSRTLEYKNIYSYWKKLHFKRRNTQRCEKADLNFALTSLLSFRSPEIYRAYCWLFAIQFVEFRLGECSLALSKSVVALRKKRKNVQYIVYPAEMENSFSLPWIPVLIKSILEHDWVIETQI